MIYNIIDRRSRPYRWRSVDAIVEATAHDDACEDSDQIEPTADDVTYAQQAAVSIADAIGWASSMPGNVTLYLYDVGAAIRPRPPEDVTRH